MIIKKDCALYAGSRPCTPNKLHGATCPACRFHTRDFGPAVLIIKLDAAGDVLRSTALLAGLRKKAGAKARICWLAASDSLPLLARNHYLDETLDAGKPEILRELLTRKWRSVYCLDNSPEAAAYCALARSGEKHGFSLSKSGALEALDPKAAYWLELACFDQMKKKNRLSYQEIMRRICGVGKISRPVFAVPAAELSGARKLLKKAGAERIIGVNTGSGSRWPKKMLAPQDTIKLCRQMLESDPKCAVALLGGPLERKTHRAIAAALKSRRVIDTGNNNSFARFAALVRSCDAIVCGDTLALHTATAVGTPAVALFGPTSIHEIHDYDGLVLKLAPKLSCLCCYGNCAKKRHCMNSLPLATIIQAVKTQLVFKRNWRGK